MSLQGVIDNCPGCGVSWWGGSILDTFIEQRDSDKLEVWQGLTDAQLQARVEELYSPPYHWRREIGVEYGHASPERYDGISEYQCPDCGIRIGRWTLRIIPDGYIESRFGKEGHIKHNPTK